MKTRMHILFGLIMATATLYGANKAQAKEVESLLYICGLNFEASGKSASLVLGYTHLKGDGVLSCYDILTGATQQIELTVTLKGPAVGVNYQTAQVSAKVLGLRLSRAPESLLGSYAAIRGSAAIGVGVGATTSLRIAKDDVSINLSLQGVKGLGAQIDFLSVELEAKNQAQKEKPQMQESNVNVKNALPIVQVYENQPIQILNAQGQVVKTITIQLR